MLHAGVKFKLSCTVATWNVLHETWFSSNALKDGTICNRNNIVADPVKTLHVCMQILVNMYFDLECLVTLEWLTVIAQSLYGICQMTTDCKAL